MSQHYRPIPGTNLQQAVRTIKKSHRPMVSKFWGLKIRLFGGRYMQRPKDRRAFTVKMAAEIKEPFNVSVPTVDFQTPRVEDLTAGIQKTIPVLLTGKKRVFVGCMGGVGRTGLFLACMLKVLGDPTPILTVREKYNSHAVETKAQEQFVADFPVGELRRFARRTAIRVWLRKLKFPFV